MQPYASSTCHALGSSTECQYYQYSPVIHSDPAIAVVLGAILLIMVANFVRYGFYR